METQVRTDGNRFCASCGTALPPVGSFCPSCGQAIQPLPANAAQPALSSPPWPQPPAPAAGQAAQMGAPGVLCPRCGSPRVQAGKRGWKWTTGMIGSGNIVITCLQCGEKFKPA